MMEVIVVVKSSSHHLSQTETVVDNPCSRRLSRLLNSQAI
jgi:hypothetical protein